VFGRMFEKHFLSQGFESNRSIDETLDLGWDLLSLLPKDSLERLNKESIEAFYHPNKASERFQVNLT
jgi:V/A-type H+/Na+-transporting ATPase subunit B